MFKQSSSQSGSPVTPRAIMDEAVMSSPEMENKKPVVPAPARLGTPSEGRIHKAKSPAGKDRAGLLAYLEDVANQGGGVSIC